MKKAVTLVVVVVVVSVIIGAKEVKAQGCVDNFDLVGSACYLISPVELTWNQSLSFCKSISLPYGKTASLARVEDCDQLSALWKYIYHNTKNYPIVDYWLGGTNTMDPDKAFRWESTGELVPMGVPMWFPGQPDFPDTERVLSLSKNGYFADEKETIPQRFICQLL